MTFLKREKLRGWLWVLCFLLALLMLLMALAYQRLRSQRPEPVWWQMAANNLDRQHIFITIDTCQGFLHQADCSPGDFNDLSLIGRSFVSDRHYQQWYKDLVENMVSPNKQEELADFKTDHGIDYWGLVFDVQIDSDSVGYFRSRLLASPTRPNLAADLAGSGLITDDQLAILNGGWYRYDSPPPSNQAGNHWFDWVEATRPFLYGQLKTGARNQLIDKLRSLGVYQFVVDDVSQFGLDQNSRDIYEYEVLVACRPLFEIWPDYSEAVDQPGYADINDPDRCDGSNGLGTPGQLVDYNLTVQVDINQSQIIAFSRQYQDEFFSRQTLSPPNQASPWDVDPPLQAEVANFDDHVGRLLPPFN